MSIMYTGDFEHILSALKSQFLSKYLSLPLLVPKTSCHPSHPLDIKSFLCPTFPFSCGIRCSPVAKHGQLINTSSEKTQGVGDLKIRK